MPSLKSVSNLVQGQPQFSKKIKNTHTQKDWPALNGADFFKTIYIFCFFVCV